MQAGRPVIATATGGPLETIIDGKTGYLCSKPLIENFGKRMKEFVDNKTLSFQMGQEGKRHVNENFSFQPFARKLNEHIHDLSVLSLNHLHSFYLLTFVFCLILSLFIRWLFF
jgi:alpha-1,3/alpha-1,6-mannosyltransferase